MVENFTTVNDNTFDNNVKEETKMIIDEQFEETIKRGIQNLKKEPSQISIDNILNYSRSFKKS